MYWFVQYIICICFTTVQTISRKLEELELISKQALPKDIVVPSFPFRLGEISDEGKRTEWNAFIKNVSVQIYFLPYSEAFQPKLKISIHRAHMIPWCVGESPSPVYRFTITQALLCFLELVDACPDFALHFSQAELLTVFNDEKMVETAKAMISTPSFPCFERRGNQPQKQLTEPSQHDHINPSWNKELKNKFEFNVTPHLLSSGQDRHQLIRFSLWHRFGDATNEELGFGSIAVKDLHAKYYLSEENTEITVPITLSLKDNRDETSNCRRFNSFLVFSVSFVGDWSADLEVERLKESEKVKESELKAVKVAEGASILLKYFMLICM